MASVCMPQVNYQHQHNSNTSTFNAMLLQQQVQQLQQQYPAKQQQQRIAPATSLAQQPTKMILGNSNLHNIQQGASNFGPLMQKKKYTYANMPYGEQLPSVARRNARERNRVKQVNNGFANLRQHLPQPVINALSNGGRGASKKLSKVDTLRIAVEYIRGLQDLLEQTDSTNGSSSSKQYLDESSNDYDDSYEPHMQQFNSYHSETSASPTPSYSDSDISIGGAAQFMQPLKLEAADQQNHLMQYKFENFDNYDDQPDDEELLDYISSWQEQA